MMSLIVFVHARLSLFAFLYSCNLVVAGPGLWRRESEQLCLRPDLHRGCTGNENG